MNTLPPPLFGHLSDRVGRTSVMAISGVIGLVIIYPLFRWLVAVPTVTTLVSIQVLIALVFYCGYYTGDVTPPAVGWIVSTTGNPTSPGLYLCVLMLLSPVCLVMARRMGVS